LGSWLDQLYDADRSLRELGAARERSKGSVAIWGPSQSGKSIFFSRYLETRDGESALEWPGGEQVKFSGHESGCDGKIVLNPFNAGTDASYCISRFSTRDTIPDPKHPVEVCLASDEQLLLFLSHGYVTECDRRDNAEKRVVRLDAEDLDECLSSLPVTTKSHVQRKAYESLHKLVSVLEALIFSRLDRYENLEDQWYRSLRRKVLECPSLVADERNVDILAARMLWDGDDDLADPISRAYIRLRQKSAALHQLFGQAKIYCSYGIAKLLLNMDTVPRLARIRRGETDVEIQGLLASESCTKIFVSDSGKHVIMDGKPEEFALVQGVVRELVFPVRKDVVEKHAPDMVKVMEVADLLDFPGVARDAGKAEQVLLSKNDLAQVGSFNVFTQVLKRGKTAAIVGAAASVPVIDVFCIFVRISDFPPNCGQLVLGIRTWWQGLRQEWPPASRVLPINLTLTFSGVFVDDVVKNGMSQGMANAFTKMEATMGPLADPSVVRYFLTTYPELPGNGGTILSMPEDVERARLQITASKEYKKYFIDDVAAINEMISNGGTSHLLKAVENQVRRSKRAAILHTIDQKIENDLRKLIIEAAPGRGNKCREQELDAWRAAIDQAIEKRRRVHPDADAAAYVSHLLRSLLNVAPEDIAPLPLMAHDKDINQYVAAQFENWRQSRKIADDGYRDLGLYDSALTTRMLGYLCDYAMVNGEIAAWIKSNLGYLTNQQDAQIARSYLVIKMAESLVCMRQAGSAHRGFTDGGTETVISRLKQYACHVGKSGKSVNDHASPHFKGFIAPFLSHLERVKNIAASDRPAQPGDEELLPFTTFVEEN
jgi:hypothetical protein